MRRVIVVGLVLLGSVSTFAQIQDTASLRRYINSRIIPNGNRSITAQNLNDIFNGFLNVWPAPGWSLNGNSGTQNAESFLGTTDTDPIMFGMNGNTAGMIDMNSQNTYLGYLAGNGLNGNSVVAFGFQALKSNRADSNTAIGCNTLATNRVGKGNTAIGSNALNSSLNSSYNVAVGQNALSNVNGSFNVGIGAYAMSNSGASTRNVIIGQSAFNNVITSANSIGIGTGTAGDLRFSTGNTIIGYYTAKGMTLGSYNTILGANIVDLPETLNNNIIISDGQGNARFWADSAGHIGIGNYTASARLHLPAGSSAAGTAPLKIAPGDTLAVPEDGVIEYDGKSYYATVGSIRYTLTRAINLNVSLSFPAISPGISSDLTASAPGAMVGDAVFVSLTTGSPAAGTFFTGFIASNGVVTVRSNNYSAASIPATTTQVHIIIFKQ